MKFNKKIKGSTRTVNRAGGDAYKQSPELELVSLLLTSFVTDKFYESSKSQLGRLKDLSEKIKDKYFLAQAAVYARKEFGMRSITHALAAHITHLVKGEQWTKRALEKVVHRPDDITEILSFYLSNYKKPIPNSMKKGLANSLKQFDAYQLAKYRGDKNEVKMVDVMNLFRPKPSKEQVKAFKDLMSNELKTTGKTWEAKLSEAGQKAKTKEDKKELKKEAWADMIKSGKIGYFALLRNLRNIVQDAPEVIPQACELLRKENLIKKSLVLPFRFAVAYSELVKINGSGKILEAIDDAADISLANVPKFDGNTLIALDESGSMDGQPWDIGKLFASVLMKANPDADLRIFAYESRALSVNAKTPVLEIARNIKRVGGGTNFKAIFKDLDKKYERVIILSDMQGWMEDSFYCNGDLKRATNEYKTKTGANPHIYSFDLAGHGDMKFPENQVYCLAGFSDKIFDVMKFLEEDRMALINKIKSVKI